MKNNNLKKNNKTNTEMLSVEPLSDCDTNITPCPMDVCDENCNKTNGPTTKSLHNPNVRNQSVRIQPMDEEILTCDISLRNLSCHPAKTETKEEEEESIQENENGNNADDDDDDEPFIDSETDLVNDECGLEKLYLREVEINGQEEAETIAELVNVTTNENQLKAEEAKGMRVALGIILRLIFPLANGVIQGIKGIRDVRFLRVLRSIASSRQSLTNLFAFAANTISMNLSSVQVTNRLEPLLKLFKIRKPREGFESLPDLPSPTAKPVDASSKSFLLSVTTTPSSPTSPLLSPFFRQPRPSLPNFQSKRKSVPFEEQLAPKCCTINILAEPPPGQAIRADIVFIHGLHGSLVNTWKQGLWENERKPVEFERPPKPPVRPPKRPRHSRSTIVYPPHRQKRARFTHPETHPKNMHYQEFNDEFEDHDYSFVCGEPRDVQIFHDIEYSFPTFRLRLNDNGRLLQAEIDSLLQDNKNSTSSEGENKENSESPTTNEGTNKKSKPAKLSATDPNYSKCWPGDWLPIDCPGVRVIAVNYTTDQHLWRPLWKNKEPRSNLTQRSKEMAELLIQHRVGYGHPIVWVGHSKGGLFIKQLIVDAWESGRPASEPFWRSARGVFFYSVPHRGSHLASIRAPLLTRSVELIDIEKNSKYLADLHRRFLGLYHMGHLKIEVFSFVETALTLMSVLYLRIVGVDSADPGIGDVCGIRLDHREICKPRSRDCILYRQLVNMINKVC